MLILLKTMIVIFTFEISFVKCVLSNHYVFLLQLLHSTMHIYLQNRCTNFSKQRIQKQLYTLEKRKGQFHFRGQGYNVHVPELPMLAQNVCNTESYTRLFLFILYFDSYQTCFYFFLVVTALVIKTHWNLFLMR